MPPRYAYWTILIDGAATAFRARERDELLPTLHQLQRKNPNVTMQWFARGKLWASREAEQEDFQRHKRQAAAPFAKAPSSGERRNADWRPGGAHKDPRDRFKKKHRPVRAWSEDDEPRDRKPQGPPRDRPWQGGKPAGPARDRPWQGKKQPGGGAPRPDRWGKDRKPDTARGELPPNRPANDERPERERSWTDRPPRENRPWQDRKPGPPRGDRPWSGKPKPGGDRPWSGKPKAGGERPWSAKPKVGGDRPWSAKPKAKGDRPWSAKPAEGRPRGDRPWDKKDGGGDKPWHERKAGGAPRGDRPWGDKPPRGAPRGDKPWQDRKPAGPPRGDRPDRPWSGKPPAAAQREKRTWSAKPPGKPEQGGERKPWRDKPGGGSRPFAPKRRDTRKRRDDEPSDE